MVCKLNWRLLEITHAYRGAHVAVATGMVVMNEIIWSLSSWFPTIISILFIVYFEWVKDRPSRVEMVFSDEVYENYVSDLMPPFCFDSGKMELKVEKEHNFEIHQGCTCPRPLQSQFISAFIYFELFHLFVVDVIFISYWNNYHFKRRALYILDITFPMALCFTSMEYQELWHRSV